MLIFGSSRTGGTDGSGPDLSILQEVRAYWEALREQGRLPLRSAIDPRGLASALEQVFLIERIAPGHARFRLAGNLFHDLMGLDVRGMPFSAIFEPAARARLQPAIEEVFEQATALHLTGQSERGIGRPALGARMLILPLRAGAQEPEMALGVLVTQGNPGRAPRRLGIATLRNETIFEQAVVSRIIRKDPSPATSAAQAPATASAPIVLHPKPRPALRLVHSRSDA